MLEPLALSALNGGGRRAKRLEEGHWVLSEKSPVGYRVDPMTSPDSRPSINIDGHRGRKPGPAPTPGGAAGLSGVDASQAEIVAAIASRAVGLLSTLAAVPIHVGDCVGPLNYRRRVRLSHRVFRGQHDAYR